MPLPAFQRIYPFPVHGPRFVCLAVACVVAAGCGSPLTGTWRGTMDLGAMDAWPLEVRVGEDPSRGRLVVQEKGRTFESFQLCTVEPATERKLELSYNPEHPDCAAPAGTAEAGKDRRTLRGTVGEGVLFGEVFRGSERIGFFRAFRQDAVAALGPQTPKPAPDGPGRSLPPEQGPPAPSR